jgi:hypothetical protein
VKVTWQVALPPGPVPIGCHWQIPGVPNVPVLGEALKLIVPSGGRVALASVNVAVQFVELSIDTVEGCS